MFPRLACASPPFSQIFHSSPRQVVGPIQSRVRPQSSAHDHLQTRQQRDWGQRAAASATSSRTTGPVPDLPTTVDEWPGLPAWRSALDEYRFLGSAGIAAGQPPWQHAWRGDGAVAPTLAEQAVHVLQTACPKHKALLTHAYYRQLVQESTPLGSATAPDRAPLQHMPAPVSLCSVCLSPRRLRSCLYTTDTTASSCITLCVHA